MKIFFSFFRTGNDSFINSDQNQITFDFDVGRSIICIRGVGSRLVHKRRNTIVFLTNGEYTIFLCNIFDDIFVFEKWIIMIRLKIIFLFFTIINALSIQYIGEQFTLPRQYFPQDKKV